MCTGFSASSATVRGTVEINQQPGACWPLSVCLVGGVPSARAADLGGDCCADLEERVAELEATTARKGNRRVSLTISGQVSTS